MGCTTSQNSGVKNRRQEDLFPAQPTKSSDINKPNPLNRMSNSKKDDNQVGSPGLTATTSSNAQGPEEQPARNRTLSDNNKDSSQKQEVCELPLFETIRNQLFNSKIRPTIPEESSELNNLRKHRQQIALQPLYHRELSKIPEVNSELNSKLTISNPQIQSRLMTEMALRSSLAMNSMIRGNETPLQLQFQQGTSFQDYSYVPQILNIPN